MDLVDGLTAYLAPEVMAQRRPGAGKLLIHIQGYGRYWLHLEP